MNINNFYLSFGIVFLIAWQATTNTIYSSKNTFSLCLQSIHWGPVLCGHVCHKHHIMHLIERHVASDFPSCWSHRRWIKMAWYGYLPLPIVTYTLLTLTSSLCRTPPALLLFLLLFNAVYTDPVAPSHPMIACNFLNCSKGNRSLVIQFWD